MSEFEHPIIYCFKIKISITCSQRISKLFHTAPSTRMLSSIDNKCNVSSMDFRLPRLLAVTGNVKSHCGQKYS